MQETNKKIVLSQVEKYLNPYFFLALNILIILVAETAGGGKLLYNSGIIHIIALIFVLLVFFRIFFRRPIYDPVLEKFVRAILAAMGVFALSHVIEFFSMMVLRSYTDGVYANTANFYIISLLLIAIGADAFLRVERRQSGAFGWMLGVIIAFISIWAVVLLFKSGAVDLDTGGPTPFVYLAVMIFATAVGLYKAWQIKTRVKITSAFVSYLVAAILLIAVAVLPNIFYDFITDKFGGAEYQAIYLSHFSFYAALSIMFLAFNKFKSLGGLLDEVAAQETDS